MNDHTLISRFRESGDRTAITELFGRYQTDLFNFIWQMLRQTQDAEDAMQETLIKAMRALPRYREENHFKSWLFRIAHHEVINTIRRRQRVELHEEPPGANRAETGNPFGARRLEGQERVSALQQAIEQLPDLERQVVLLRMQQELSFKQIAEVIDAPIGTVLGRMHHAKQRLKKALQPEDSSHET